MPKKWPTGNAEAFRCSVANQLGKILLGNFHDAHSVFNLDHNKTSFSNTAVPTVPKEQGSAAGLSVAATNPQRVFAGSIQNKLYWNRGAL
jgi:hypothetical protein